VLLWRADAWRKHSLARRGLSELARHAAERAAFALRAATWPEVSCRGIKGSTVTVTVK